MNWKLAVALCCLLATVQARPGPKSESSKCSLTCSPQRGWQGYQKGSTYQYKFNHMVMLASNQNSKQSSRIQLSGVAEIEAHDDCEMVMTIQLSETQVNDINKPDTLNPRETPEKVIQALKKPLRFSYQNGQVIDLCPSSDETRASLNMKRGILSHLQVSIDQRGQGKRLKEKDILGDCWTEYTAEDRNTFMKIKDLSACHLNYRYYPRTGVRGLLNEETQARNPTTRGSLKCRIELDPKKNIVKRTQCIQDVKQGSGGPSSANMETVRTTTNVELQDELESLKNELKEVKTRTDLTQEHKTNDECFNRQNGMEEEFFSTSSECLQILTPATGKESKDFKNAATRTLRQLCEDTKSNSVKRSVAKLFGDLIKYLRGITDQKDFNDLYRWVRNEHCQDNPLLADAYIKAFGYTGTKQALRLIMSEIRAGKLWNDRNFLLAQGLNLLDNPTTDILPEVLKFTQDSTKSDDDGKESQLPLLSLGSVIYKICEDNKDCEKDTNVRQVIDYFSDALGQSCNGLESKSSEAMNALLSIANMGRIRGGKEVLIKCAKDEKLQMAHRVIILNSLHRFTEWSPEEIEQLIELLMNKELDSELRVAVYQTLARFNLLPSSPLINSIEKILENEQESEQVQFYIYTHLQNQQKSIKRLVNKILTKPSIRNRLSKLSRRQYSSNLAHYFYSTVMGTGLQTEANAVFSEKSAIPRSVNLNLTADIPALGGSVNLMEVTIRAEGLEKLIQETYDLLASKSEDRSELSRNRRQADFRMSEKQQQLEEEKSEPRLDIFTRKFGGLIDHSRFDSKMLSWLPQVMRNYKKITPVVGQYIRRVISESMTGSIGTLNDNTLTIPTITGVPVIIKEETHYFMRSGVDPKIKSATGKDFNFNMIIKPAANVHTTRTVAVDAIFERAGIETSTTFLSSGGAKIDMNFNMQDPTDRKFSFRVEPLEAKQTIADVSTQVNFFQHTAKKQMANTPMKVEGRRMKSFEKCLGEEAEKYLGLKLCTKAQYYESGSMLNSLRRTPGHYQLYLEKRSDFGAFEMEFAMKNKKNTKELKVLVGDKKLQARHVLFQLQSNNNAKTAEYKMDFTVSDFVTKFYLGVNKETSSHYKIKLGAQTNSISYNGSAEMKYNEETGMKLDGEFKRNDQPRPKIGFSLSHKYSGLVYRVLPECETELELTVNTDKKLKMRYQLAFDEEKYNWEAGYQYEENRNKHVDLNSRIQYQVSQRGAERRSTFLYDFSMQGSRVPQFNHNLHSKLTRKAQGQKSEFSVVVDHKMVYGKHQTHSPLDFTTKINLKEQSSDKKMFIATGNGEFIYYSKGKQVDAKLQNLEVQSGEIDEETTGMQKLKVYSASFNLVHKNAKKNFVFELKFLPRQLWTWYRQSLELKAMADKDQVMHIRHTWSKRTGMLSQFVDLKYDNEQLLKIDHQLKKETNSIEHSLFVQEIMRNTASLNSNFEWKTNVFNFGTALKINKEAIFSTTNVLEYISEKDNYDIKHNMELQVQSYNWGADNSLVINRQSADDYVRMVQYLPKLFGDKFDTPYVFSLIKKYSTALKMKAQLSFIDKNMSDQKMNAAVQLDVQNSNGVVCDLQIANSMTTDSPYDYAIVLSRKSSGTFELKKGQPVQQAVQLKFKSGDNTLESEVQVKVEQSDDDKYKIKVNGTSKDTWNMHDMKLDGSGSLVNKEKQLELQGNIETKGKFNEQSMDSKTTVKAEYQKESRQMSIDISGSGAESKFKLQQKLTVAEKEITGNIQINSDLPFLQINNFVTDLKSSKKLELPFKAELNCKLDNKQKLSMMAQVEQKKVSAQIKTALEKFKEFEFVSSVESAKDNANHQYDMKVKLDASNRVIEVQDKGTVRLQYNTETHLVDALIDDKVTMKGLEDYFNHTQFTYKAKVQLKKNFEYTFLNELYGSAGKAKNSPLIHVSSEMSRKPFNAQAKVSTTIYFENEQKLAVTIKRDDSTALAQLEVSDRQAKIEFNKKNAEKKKQISFTAQQNIIADKKQMKTIKGEAEFSWPLKSNDFEAKLKMQLPWKQMEKVEVEVENRKRTKKGKFTFVADGKTVKLFDAKFDEKVERYSTYGKGTVEIDMSHYYPETKNLKLKGNYAYGEEKILNLTSQSNDNANFEMKILLFSSPRSMESIGHGNFGFLLKTDEVTARILHQPKEGRDKEWQFDIKLKSGLDLKSFVQFEGGKLKHGEVRYDGSVYTISSPSSKKIVFDAKTNGKSIYHMQMGFIFLGLRRIEAMLIITANGNIAIIEATKRGEVIKFKYGKQGVPNVLRIDLRNPKIVISHQTKPTENTKIEILPNLSIPLPMSNFPFRVEITSEKNMNKFTINMNSLGHVDNFLYSHDITDFPIKFSMESKLQIVQGGEEQWKTVIDCDLRERKVDMQSQIANVYKFSLKEDSVLLRVEKVLDVQFDYPNIFIRSSNKQLRLQLTAPIFQINDQFIVSLATTKEAEAKQIIFKLKQGSKLDFSSTVEINKFIISREFNIDLAAGFTSKDDIWSTNIRSASVEIQTENKRESSGYAITGKSLIKVNSNEWSTNTLKLSGKTRSWPRQAELKMSGIVESALSYELYRGDGTHSLNLNVEKVGETRQKYELVMSCGPVNKQAWIRDFQLRFECPRRTVLISKKATNTDATLELYLNKEAEQGMTITYKIEGSSGKPTATVEVQLPTRKVRMTAETEINDQFKMRSAVEWDVEKDPKKVMSLDMEIDTASYSSASLQCKGPFLREPLKMKYQVQSTTDGFKVMLEHVFGDNDKVTAELEYNSEDQLGSGKKTILIKTTGASGKLDAELNIVVRSKSGSPIWSSQHNCEMKLQIPSQKIDRSMKFVYQPMKELTVMCDRGTALQLKLSSNKRFSELVLFVSVQEQGAARLAMAFDQHKKMAKAILLTGKGTLDYEADEPQLNLRPEAMLLRGSAGLSSEDQQLHAALYVGKMNIGEKFDLQKPSEVPAHINFFSVGAKVDEKNVLSYFSNWKVNTDQLEQTIGELTTTLWSNQLTANFDQVKSALRQVYSMLASRVTNNFNVYQIIEELNTFASVDLDRFYRYLQTTFDHNEFFFQDLVSYARSTVAAVQNFFRYAQTVMSDLITKISDILPDLDLPYYYHRIVRSIKGFFDNMYSSDMWRSVMNNTKNFIWQVKQYTKSCIETMKDFIQRASESIFNNDNGDSLISIAYEMVKEALELEKVQELIDAMYNRMSTYVGQSVRTMATSFNQNVLLPIYINYIPDLIRAKEIIENVKTQIKIFYDNDASESEREAYSRTVQLLSYFTSQDSKDYWRNVEMSYSKLLNGKYSEALEQFLKLSQNVVGEWKRQSGGQPGKINGSVYIPVYMPTLNPMTWKAQWDAVLAPIIVAQRLKNKIFATSSDGYVLLSALNDWRQSGSSYWNPISSILSMKHYTAVILGDNHLITFDGVTIKHRRPCSYIVAHDFKTGTFSVVQTYKKDSTSGKSVRGQLLVRFGRIEIAIDRNGVFKIGEKIEKLPVKKMIGGNTVEADKKDKTVKVRFHAELKNVLVVQCNQETDSCAIKVHPLYHGAVKGLAGTNDNRKSNEIRENADQHISFWTAGECVETGEATIIKNEESNSESNGLCKKLFEQEKAKLDKCFDTVNPRPFMNLCKELENKGKNPCKVVSTYVERCRDAGVNANIPRECAKCKISEGKEINEQDVISNKAELQRRTQVVFLIEKSNCGLKAIGKDSAKSENIDYLATLIDRLAPSNSGRSVEFGLATFSSSADNGNSGMQVYRLSKDSKTFGDFSELREGVAQVMESSPEKVESLDVLKALSQLNDKLDWEPLAMKHVVIISCKQCNSRSWEYSTLFDEAFKTVKDQIHLHVISKDAIPQAFRPNDFRRNMIGYDSQTAFYSDRRTETLKSLSLLKPTADCTTELALDAQNEAKGSVWNLNVFMNNDRSGSSDDMTPSANLSRQLYQNVIKQRFDQPKCRRCSCSLSNMTAAKPRCRIVQCM